MYKMSWSLDGNRVNGATLLASMIVRLVFLVAGVALIAAFTPLGVGQSYGLTLAVGLLFFSRTATLQIGDA